jgi:hypothetical protein
LPRALSTCTVGHGKSDRHTGVIMNTRDRVADALTRIADKIRKPEPEPLNTFGDPCYKITELASGDLVGLWGEVEGFDEEICIGKAVIDYIDLETGEITVSDEEGQLVVKIENVVERY